MSQQTMAEALTKAGVRKSRTTQRIKKDAAPKTAAPKAVKSKRETASQMHARIDRDIENLLSHLNH